MNEPVQPDRAQQVFLALQAAVRKIVADKLSPAVEFHASRHFFFIHRPGRPELSLDVWLETEVPHIHFATNIRAVGHLVIEAFAGNENRIRNGDRLMTVEEAADLLLTPFGVLG